MEKAYRALVVFTAVAAVFCTASVIFAGVRISASERSAPAVSRIFSWEAGRYQIEGCIDRGILSEMHIFQKSE